MSDKPQKRPFDRDTAQAIIQAFRLPKNRLYEWQNRGFIPAPYFTDANPLTLTLSGESITKPLFFWRTYHGLLTKHLAEWVGTSYRAVINWENGYPIPEKKLAVLIENLQRLNDENP